MFVVRVNAQNARDRYLTSLLEMPEIVLRTSKTERRLGSCVVPMVSLRKTPLLGQTDRLYISLRNNIQISKYVVEMYLIQGLRLQV